MLFFDGEFTKGQNSAETGVQRPFFSLVRVVSCFLDIKAEWRAPLIGEPPSGWRFWLPICRCLATGRELFLEAMQRSRRVWRHPPTLFVPAFVSADVKSLFATVSRSMFR